MGTGENDNGADDPTRPLPPRFVQGRIKGKPIKYTRASRKHKIGREHVRVALRNAGDPRVVPASSDFPFERLVYVGQDDRGLELEIVAIERRDCVSVIHVMPTAFRGRTS